MAVRNFPDEWLVPTITALVSAEAVEAMRAEAQPTSALWEMTTTKKLATDEAILNALAKRTRLKIADLTVRDGKVKELIPQGVAQRYRVVPLRATDSYLDVGTANPYDLDAEKALAFSTGREVRMHLASPARIAAALDELYRPENVVEKLLEGMGENTEVTQLEEEVPADEIQVSAEEASQRPVVRLVDLILSEGILNRASDIHIEPEEGSFSVRYRIDGVLRQVMKIPRAAGFPLVSRIKIISNLDIADRMRPQDGRARVAVNGVPVDLRVSTLPASMGEKVVIRVLDSRATVLSLDNLGLNTDEADALRALLLHHEGIVLVTGPTGSGKTTTLYSSIRHIMTGKTNIVTVEDPVEYRIQGIVQVQVHEKAGLTFSSALRSILRQDPDVVLVGEIRDKETAVIAMQASLTGHLVLSTLHTNDAANAITRLVDIGLEPYKIAASLRGVIAQRLMRKLCPACKEVGVDSIPPKLQRWIPAGTPLYRAVGCPDCSMTGYRGRFSIVEVLTMTPEIEKIVGSGAPADRIAEAARAAGMRGLWESGVAHVTRGESSIEELMRVVDVPFDSGPGDATAAAPSTVEPAQRQARASRISMNPMTAVAEVVEDGGRLDFTSEAFELLDSIGKGSRLQQLQRKVLLVDDEDSLRRVMKDLLEREGYTVAEARDGVAALDQVDKFGPDVVVLDLNLPGLDGYGVLSHLRSRPATVNVPVIVLTAKGDEDNEVRVFELGADDFLTKPFRARALSARIDVVLNRRRTPS
ncbi:MAG TPA: type II/IV secretion system protein [Gemmatimonadales bacterium]|jgi:type II secretory ATPase GspE/PulE/Tfp pilus assembly ATPase PilB-like protein/ActR/RegA family two-component response regulator